MAQQKSTDIMQGLRDAWCGWVDEAAYLDDTTALVLHTSERLPDREYRFNCQPENMASARHFLETWARHSGYEEKDIGLITLGFDEVVTNVFKHAYETKPGEIACQVSIEEDHFVVRLKHWGKAMGEMPEDITLPPEDALCGRGLFVIHQVFDSCHHTDGSHQNEIILTKALSGPSLGCS
ncbi:MAG: ATP-binding protein [Verrucomicrobiota bacterium]